ncbi:helix-turn-helix transcriptional regulator [Halobellus litoreus]|uniref:Helix-turn-helix transcriptional regulator n=1 Tax=Halobellus litoreus TaxID=755310 RepID=A0ABD6DZ02_9EURY|nr:MarR family transcriptional regulator [Halobellus litoreus]
MVTIKGSTSSIHRVPSVYTLRDVVVLLTAAWVGGITTGYLWFTDYGPSKPPADTDDNKTASIEPDNSSTATVPDPLERQKRIWESNLETLADDEQQIYELVLQHDGYLEQQQVVAETDLSQSTVSRKLDLLERDGLIERKRRGMGNVVSLTDTNRKQPQSS